MSGNRRRCRGSVSLMFLLLLTTGTVFLTALGRALWQQLANQRESLEARQWAQLFTSFCSVRNRVPVKETQGTKLVTTVKLSPEEPPLKLYLQSFPLEGRLGWQEMLYLETASGYRPMKASRYSLAMPGSRDGGLPEGAIWCPATGVTLSDVSFASYKLLATGPVPDGRRLVKPVPGCLYYTALDKKAEPLKYAGTRKLAGRGVFVTQLPLILDRGFRLQGDVRIFCARNVEIRDDVTLDKVFIYSGGTINIGKNSQVKGILAAKKRVELEKGASVTEDRSVLEPFRTLYL